MTNSNVEITDYEMELLIRLENGSLTNEIAEMCENLEVIKSLEVKGFLTVDEDMEFVTLTAMGQDCVGCY